MEFLKIAKVFLPAVLVWPVLFSQMFGLADDKDSGAVFLRIIVTSSLEQAQHVLAELSNGANFATVAQNESIDSTASDGGLLGRVAIWALRPELRDAITGVAPGQISAVVKTAIGYAILKVEKEDGSARAGNLNGNEPAAINSTGSVKYTLSLGGLQEAELGLNNFIKPFGWDRDPKKICEVRKQSMSEEKGSLTDLLAAANSEVRKSFQPVDLLNAYYSLGEIYSYEGGMDHAVAQYEKAHQVAHLNEHAAERQMDEAMGVALLHKSEMENGVYRTPGDRCLAPMRPSSAYANKQDSKKAIEYFLKYLEQKPDELEVRWLLNLAYAVWVDINNDGLLDLFVGNEGQPAQLFLNRGDGTFEDISVNSDVNRVMYTKGVAAGDYDNDGFPDLYVSNLNGDNFLYHNNHDNTFTRSRGPREFWVPAVVLQPGFSTTTMMACPTSLPPATSCRSTKLHALIWGYLTMQQL